ncbi:protein kinase [Colletotrichum scovillei]|uniref:protein kinase n=1 Tax=Colletotrichum scovillei TaxID=1209932 RepID=UPI0015C36603|nr:protein kinase [Colletotrichum scovillei]KAF4776102.1 protein kinase [Colletotrichum scovillei]
MVETTPEDDTLALPPSLPQPENMGPTQPLKQLLEAAMCRSLNLNGGDFKEFLPEPALNRILTPQSALAALTSSPGIADLMCSIYAVTIFNKQKTYIKTFAILVLIGRVDALPAFMLNSLSDEHLPLTLTSTSGEKTTLVRSLTTPSCSDLSLMGLSHYEALSFEATQWKLLAPVFARRQLEDEPLEFPEGTILPIVMPESYEGFQTPRNSMSHSSRIYQAHIHAGHHDFPFSKVEALKVFGDMDQSHIIELLATFKLGKNYYLIFPWAESDLRSFFATESPSLPRPIGKAVVPAATWTAKQMLGIAEALKAIHYCRQTRLSKSTSQSLASTTQGWGRHGDIKPENILFFHDRVQGQSQLVVADLGLTRIHSATTASKAERPAGFTYTYRPPECDVGLYDGRKADIWSLGCVMSVAATWMILGSKGVKTFDTNRLTKADDGFDNSFFEVSKDREKGIRVKLKAAVSHWISQLHRAPTASMFTHDLLNLIQSGMLEVDGSKRLSSGDIVSSLEKMYDKCRGDPSYTKADHCGHMASSLGQQRLLTGPPHAPQARPLAVNMMKLPTSTQQSQTLPATTCQARFGSDYTSSTAGPFPEFGARLSVTLPTSFSEPFLPGQAHYGAVSQPYSAFGQMGFFTSPAIGELTSPTVEQYLPSSETPPVPELAATEPASGRKRVHEPESNKTEVKRQRSQKSRKTKAAFGTSGLEDPVDPSSESLAGAQDEARPFACPYYKNDPKNYCKKKWKLCGSSGWETIPRLKEHLYRAHHKPGLKCSRCLERLPSREDLDKHYNAKVRCVRRDDKVDDMMDDAQWGLCQAQMRRKPGAYKWGEIYKILFGSNPSGTMPSPYRDDLEMFCEMFCEFLESKKRQSPCDKFSIDEFMNLVREYQNLGSLTQSTDVSEMLPSLTGGWSNNSTLSSVIMPMENEPEAVHFEYERTTCANYQSQQTWAMGQDALGVFPDESQSFPEEFGDLLHLDPNGSVI